MIDHRMRIQVRRLVFEQYVEANVQLSKVHQTRQVNT
jgi:hypothetical protein